jgi:hypothetical protein
MEEVLDVDSRLVQSIKFLFIKPGFLTREYVRGRRVSYLPPLRIYLVASVLFFLSMSLKTMIPELQSNRILQELSDFGEEDSSGSVMEAVTDGFAAGLEKEGLVPADPDSSSGNMTLTIDNSAYDVEQGDFLADFRDNLATMMFLLLPVAAFLLKLLYWRRKKLYVEHLIFSLHVHAFIFSLLLLTVILPFKLVMWLVILVSMVYVYLAMKYYYEQSYAKTATKLSLLIFSYGLSLMLVMMLTLVGTALGLAMGGAG